MEDPNITSQNSDSASPMDAFFNQENSQDQALLNNQQGSITQTQVPSPQQEFELNTRFRNIQEAEQAVRNFQSRYDKLTAEYNKLQKEYEPKGKYAQLLEEIVTDDNALQAFVRQVKPDLIPTKDLDTMVIESLAKEFGSEFQYDPQQALVPGRHRQYAMRMDELYNTLKTQTEMPTLKELREAKAQEQQVREQQRIQAIEEIKNVYKVDDNQIGSMLEWFSALKPIDIYKLYANTLRNSNSSLPPSLANVRGQFLQQNSRAVDIINQLF